MFCRFQRQLRPVLNSSTGPIQKINQSRVHHTCCTDFGHIPQYPTQKKTETLNSADIQPPKKAAARADIWDLFRTAEQLHMPRDPASALGETPPIHGSLIPVKQSY